MPFNEFSFRDIKQQTPVSVSHPQVIENFYKLQALDLQQAVEGTEPHLKDAQPPSNPYPENIILNIHLREDLGHTVLMHMEPWQLYFP